MADADLKSLDVDVDIKPLYHYNEFKRALKDFDPEIRKEMDKTIRGFINPIAKSAKQLVKPAPLSGWRKRPGSTSKWSDTLAWDPTKVKSGIAVRQGKRRPKGVPASRSVVAWGIYSRHPAGAIYELAGKKSSGTTVAGRTFVKVLMDRGGRPSRLIWRAFDEHGGGQAIQRDIARTIKEYESLMGHRLR
jgi:hypothetical protein